jgi:predicted Zn finger-like uncharacterized protein
MSLVTRCPRCRTLFRVTPAQLQARAGQVRCGRCMHAFDGYAALTAEQASAARAADHEPAEVETMRTDAPQTEPAFASADLRENADGEARVAGAPPPAAEPAPVASALEEEHATAFGQRPLSAHAHAWGWVAGSGVLVLALALQIAYAYRSDVAARYPAGRPLLMAFCEIAGCSVTLPQRPELVKIEASDVHMIDAHRPALVQLTATLRSYASYDLAYPALDLVLTNANEHALARRIFTPREYLAASRDPNAGIPPNAEITVALELDTGDLNAAGFRLDLLPALAL